MRTFCSCYDIYTGLVMLVAVFIFLYIIYIFLSLSVVIVWRGRSPCIRSGIFALILWPLCGCFAPRCWELKGMNNILFHLPFCGLIIILLIVLFYILHVILPYFVSYFEYNLNLSNMVNNVIFCSF